MHAGQHAPVPGGLTGGMGSSPPTRGVASAQAEFMLARGHARSSGVTVLCAAGEGRVD